MIFDSGAKEFSFIELLRKTAISQESEIEKVLKTWSNEQKLALKKQISSNQLSSIESGYDDDPFQQKVRRVLIEAFGINF